MRTLLASCGLGLLAVTTACGPAEEEEVGIPLEDAQLAGQIESALGQFDSNPKDFMDRLPTKFVANEVSFFTPQDVSTKSFLTAKNERREDSKMDAPGANDQARNLVDSLKYTSLSDMHSNGLRKAQLAESPWSDDYWGLYAGSLAKRYADPGHVITEDWKKNTDYVRNKLGMAPTNIDQLSPAEKYDLLVGDANKTMTKYNLDTGKDYFAAYNKVETWMGVCHGWAPAAYMLQRPTNAITVTAADGVTKIKFFPSDIKALGTLLWATTNPPTKFIGGRCNVKDPQKDAIGRIKDQACRDTNAGTWHLAVVNQIGANKRSFVLDATFDYEVWNQPVYKYDYAYFNPRTNKSYSTLSGARVKAADFTTDKFKAYRAPGTVYIVGVAMNAYWTVETRPSHANPDSPSKDAISGARYLYTLELDANNNIIGGEWLSNAHPDFLWTPPTTSKALSAYDRDVTGTWDGTSAMPASWRTAAANSSRGGQPLSAIVSKLVELARK